MRLKWMSIILIGLTIVVGWNLLTPVASASSQYTIKMFPKRYRGTWYTYEGGRYFRVKISATRMQGGNSTRFLHVRKKATIGDPRVAKHPNWLIANVFKYQGQTWLWAYGWNQGAGAGEYYQARHHRIRGKSYDTLQLASGAGAWVDGYAYRSKRAARQFHSYRFGDENYR